MSHDCQVQDKTSRSGAVYWVFVCICGARGRLRTQRWRATRDARRHQEEKA